MITTIAIPTKDRPALLKRAARSYVENAQKYHHEVTLLVVDGSTDPAMRNANREALSEVSRQLRFTKIRYVSNREIAPYVSALVREGVDKEAALFGLGDPLELGFNAGAARNALLLETIGETILMADDDTTSELAYVPQKVAHFRRLNADEHDPVAIDPTEFWFFDSRDEALMKARNLRKGIDTLKMFNRPLGRVPSDLKHEYARDHVVRGDLRSNAITISQAGVLGDIGFSWSGYPLLKGGLTMTNVRAKVQLTRAAMRATAGPCVQSGSFCYTHAMGLDNSKPLPPFLPIHVSNGRGGENLYGTIYRACNGQVVVAFIPFALVHDPPGNEKFTRASLDWGADIRLHDVLVEALTGFRSGFSRAGAHVQDLAGDGFEDWLRASMQSRGERFAQKIEARKAAYRPRDVPNGWHTAMDAVLGLHGNVSKMDNYAAPKDLKGSPKERIELTKKIVSNFGKLLSSWQDLRTAAANLRKKHQVRMSLPL